MALNVSESLAVCRIVDWVLGTHDQFMSPSTDSMALANLMMLLHSGHKRLGAGMTADELSALWESRRFKGQPTKPRTRR